MNSMDRVERVMEWVTDDHAEDPSFLKCMSRMSLVVAAFMGLICLALVVLDHVPTLLLIPTAIVLSIRWLIWTLRS